MGSADRCDWEARVEGMLASYENQFHSLTVAIEKLSKQFDRLTISQPRPVTPAPLFPDPIENRTPSCSRDTPVCLPDQSSGDPTSCCSFLIQCSLHFTHQLSAFPTEQSKVAFVLSLLSGPACEWEAAEWAQESPGCSSFEDFAEELTWTFDPTKPRKDAAFRLTHISQGNKSVAEYAVEFRTLAASNDWNETAQYDMF